MSDPFLGEVKVFPYGFAPKGWAACDGSLLSIAQNQALFSILGTTYGGDGRVTFALPDLRGRVPVHPGTSMALGTSAGETNHTLTTPEMPMHTHQVSGGSATADQKTPAGMVWGASTANPFATTQPDAQMNAAAIGGAGGSQPHDNMQPYNTFNFCIALVGIFPSRN